LPTSAASADAPAIVLLLDDLDTSRRDAHRVIRAAEQAFAAIPPSALVSVLTTSGLGGSLLTLEPPGARHLERIRAFRGQLLVRALTPGGVSSMSSTAPFSDGMSAGASLDTADPTRAARRAATVAATAEILGRSGSRRKVLLWVTQTMGVSVEDPHGSRAAQRRAWVAALENDVTVYVLDPRGNTGGAEDPDEKRSGGTLRVGGSAMSLEVDDLVAVPLTQLTRETGGRYVTMANNYGQIMADIIEQNSTSYLLVYESPVSRTPGRHRIDVRVKRPGAKVSARRGYIVEAPAPNAPPPTTADDTLLRRTLLGSAPQGKLRLTVHAVPRFATDKSGAVSVTVLADDAGGPLTSPLDVVLATFDDDGRATNQHQVRLDPPPAGARLEFSTELPLSRGHHQLRVAAVTADATKTGLVITPIEVIEPGKHLVMAPPLLLQEANGKVLPTTSRRFVAGTSVAVQAEVAGRPVQEGKVAVKLIVTDTSGAVVKTADATLDVAGLSDRRRATGLVDTSGLGPGTYFLTLEAGTGNSDNAVRHAIPVRLDAAPAVSTAGVLRHSVVAHGPTSNHREPGTFVIRDEATWRQFWSHLPTRQATPDIDFSRVTLFAVVAGSRDGASSSRPTVLSVKEAPDGAVVTWKAEPHATSGAFTVVAVPQVLSGQIRFETVQ
jgi:VWFA-related protein